jgi:hypothetical protein
VTATTGAAKHPDVSELSDLTEGLLPSARTTEVRRHVDACELCADVLDSLTEIRDLLGTLPGPPQMPADVAGRIDAALAAEALLDATHPGDTTAEAATVSAAAQSAEPVESPEPTMEPRVSRETASSSSEAEASGASGAPGAPGASDRPAGHPRAATGPGRRSSGPRRRRRNVAGAVLGAVATVAAVGLGALLLQPGGTNSSDSGTTNASEQAAPQTFAGGPLEDQVTSLLAAKRTPAPDASKPSFDTESSPRTPRSNSPMRSDDPDVPKCVALGIGQDAPPLAAKKGTYEGKLAYLVVLPDTSDSSRVTAYVVDAACAENASPGKGEVLLTRSYPRS